MWIEFDGLRVKEALSVTDLCKDAPVYHSHSKELREKLADEMLYIVNHPQESSFHLIGHLYLFLDYLLQSAKSTKLVSSGRMSDYYIKEAINYIEQNFQNNISIEDIAAVCGINRSYFGKIFRNSIGRSPGISYELPHGKGYGIIKADFFIHCRCRLCCRIRKSASFFPCF